MQGLGLTKKEEGQEKICPIRPQKKQNVNSCSYWMEHLTFPVLGISKMTHLQKVAT